MFQDCLTIEKDYETTCGLQRQSRQMVAGKGFTLGLKKKMNKIKDDELDTNVQSEGYKTGGVQ